MRRWKRSAPRPRPAIRVSIGARRKQRVDGLQPASRSATLAPIAISHFATSSAEAATLVVFELEEAPGGTRLTITESGFSQIPMARRAKAFTANEGGWTAQLGLLEKYLATPPS